MVMRHVVDLNKGVLGQGDSLELWTEIISHIPDEVLTKPGVRILSVACGHCTEAVIIAKRMLALGVSKENVNDAIYLIDKYSMFTNPAKILHGFKNVITGDFLTWETDMKFDVVVGNPPYQAPKKGDYSFWARFVSKTHRMLSDGGYLTMVIPAGWMSPTNDIRQGQQSVMRDIFAKENTFFINIDPLIGKKFFPGVGQKFSWFVLQKGKYSSTKFDLGEEQINVDISHLPMLAKDTDITNIQIIAKLSKYPVKWNFTRYIMEESWDDIKFTSSSKFQYPKINGNSNHLDKVVFSKVPCRFQGNKKVVLPYNGSNYSFVVDAGKFGCTNAYVSILDKSDRIKSAKTYFNSPLIKWVGKNKFTQYNEGALINVISKMDLTKDLSVTDIYEFYGLTQEEIDYIEANVK